MTAHPLALDIVVHRRSHKSSHQPAIMPTRKAASRPRLREPFEHDGETVITAQVTLSVEDWMLLVENESVGMFQADTLGNRIKSLLFLSFQWRPATSVGSRMPIGWRSNGRR
jgi:hypothetical protein